MPHTAINRYTPHTSAIITSALISIETIEILSNFLYDGLITESEMIRLAYGVNPWQEAEFRIAVLEMRIMQHWLEPIEEKK